MRSTPELDAAEKAIHEPATKGPIRVYVGNKRGFEIVPVDANNFVVPPGKEKFVLRKDRPRLVRGKKTVAHLTYLMNAMGESRDPVVIRSFVSEVLRLKAYFWDYQRRDPAALQERIKELRSVMQLSGQYVTMPNGAPPTAEELAMFFFVREMREKMLKEAADARATAEKTKLLLTREFWTSRFEKAVEFFGWDEQEAMERLDKPMSREQLIHQLATVLFDSHGNHGHGEDEECLDKLKRLFPSEYTEALEAFYLGNHDT